MEYNVWFVEFILYLMMLVIGMILYDEVRLLRKTKNWHWRMWVIKTRVKYCWMWIMNRLYKKAEYMYLIVIGIITIFIFKK